MKHNDVKMLDGSMEGLFIPSEAGSAVPGSLHIDGRFLVYRDAQGEQSIEILDGNDFVEYIAVLARIVGTKFKNLVDGRELNAKIGTENPKVNPSYAVFDRQFFAQQQFLLGYTLNTQDFTAECWRWADSAIVVSGYPHDIITASNLGFRMSARHPGREAFYVRFANEDYEIPRPAETNNEWHHYALEREGTTLRAYINGKVMMEKTILANASPGAIGIIVGSQYANNMPVNHIDEVVFTKLAKYKGENFVPKNKPIVLP